jgi:hypothetical protein
LVVALLWTGSAAEAGSTAGAFSLQIPPSARSEGMGRAYYVLDQGPMAAWGNVGGLAFADGVQGAATYSRLAEGLSDDAVHFYYGTASTQIALLKHLPMTFDFNFTRLDYGESPLTDGSSTQLGTFSSCENVFGVATALQIGRRVGIGFGVKKVQIDLLSGVSETMKSQLGLEGGKGSSVAYDLGALGRFPVGVDESGQVKASVLAGVTVKNLGSNIDLTGWGDGDPLPRNLQAAIGFDLFALPVAEAGWFQGTGSSSLIRDTSVFGASVAMGFEKSLISSDLPDSVASRLSYLERHEIILNMGGELRLLDYIALRAGYIHDETGGIEAWTHGVGLSLFRWGGLDFASIPQAFDLPRVDKWSLWVRVPLS